MYLKKKCVYANVAKDVPNFRKTTQLSLINRPRAIKSTGCPGGPLRETQEKIKNTQITLTVAT
jgi:hypothetical protein